MNNSIHALQSNAAVVGAGILGRLMALKLSLKGYEVSIFDQNGMNGQGSCSFMAAGMLAPFCELETGSELVFDLGLASLRKWPEIIARLNSNVFFQKQGSLVVAHPSDRVELEKFHDRTIRKLVSSKCHRNLCRTSQSTEDIQFEELDESKLQQLEPALDSKFLNGFYFPQEGQLDTRELLAALTFALKRQEVKWHVNCFVEEVEPNKISSNTETFHFDWIIDCRGLGAKNDIQDLRGVRGELLVLKMDQPAQKEQTLFNRPIRILNPRYSIYVVPRPLGKILVGATCIESSDMSPISVRSTLELLSSAYTLSSSISEARIIETVVGLRPTLQSQEPQIQYQPGLIRINGLYRHGFLISPELVEVVWDLISTGESRPDLPTLFKEAS